jgi:glycosyltransferase involved in cell wall biosynthesis
VTGHGRLFLGKPDDRAELLGLLRTATCFVMPTKHETFGIAYAEAAYAGLPSIGTSVGGAVETIGPGGLVVDPDDDDALLEAMRTMADADTARRLGALASEHTRPYTWPLVAERVLRALQIPRVDPDRLAPFLPMDPETAHEPA